MGSKLYEALAISEQHEPPHMKHRTELLNIKKNKIKYKKKKERGRDQTKSINRSFKSK